MTRKKFVKQLMAMGYNRNRADAIAQSVHQRCSSYDAELTQRIELYERLKALGIKPEQFDKSMENLSATVSRMARVLGRVIGQVASQIAEVFEKIAENINENEIQSWLAQPEPEEADEDGGDGESVV